MAKKKKQSSNQLEIQNAAKTLFANIRFMSVDEPIKSIVITSSVPNEGKSTVSVNLAQAMATAGKRVLLVEADMRRRSLASMLKVRASSGLYAVFSEASRLDLIEALQPSGESAGKRLRLCDLRHAAGWHVRGCCHPFDAR